jgi:hypothetical protein
MGETIARFPPQVVDGPYTYVIRLAIFVLMAARPSRSAEAIGVGMANECRQLRTACVALQHGAFSVTNGSTHAAFHYLNCS